MRTRRCEWLRWMYDAYETDFDDSGYHSWNQLAEGALMKLRCYACYILGDLHGQIATTAVILSSNFGCMLHLNMDAHALRAFLV
jgi:hypothetical protein